MGLFGQSALDLIRAQRRGVEDYYKWRRGEKERLAVGEYPRAPWENADLCVAWKCGWNQAQNMERICAHVFGQKRQPIGVFPLEREGENIVLDDGPW